MEKVKMTEHDSYSTEDDDSLNIASKCWERITDAAIKTGYREGIQDGADSILQEGFDLDIATVLDKTRRGACWICIMESQNKIGNIHENVQFSEILNNQRIHSAAVISRLHEYFEPILNESSIETN
ncbi:uncharacterized protein LOC105253837 isoform X2 [Camponotus floridanus]|uniref:uncharacterized protein LOC105253837 isoform X2 n=1 Tax=Camponotus floridanus TaxID=104421 RepID=UPI0009716413|nr:uncharacterized protein LOC105253837 isoform X2 [Camponotus floridanus]